MPRNPTAAQIEASRRNGARSNGPVTAEGKSIVSRNARKLSVSPRRIADSLLLPGESSKALESLIESVLEEYPPANQIELGYVNMAVAAQWRLRRIHAVEQASLIAAAAANPKSTVVNTPDGNWSLPAAEVAEAFKEVHSNKGHGSVIQISEARYGRQYTHALQQLRALQAGRELPVENNARIFGVHQENVFHYAEVENPQYSLEFGPEDPPENKPENPETKPEKF